MTFVKSVGAAEGEFLPIFGNCCRLYSESLSESLFITSRYSVERER